jgi:hypothetical protein
MYVSSLGNRKAVSEDSHRTKIVGVHVAERKTRREHLKYSSRAGIEHRLLDPFQSVKFQRDLVEAHEQVGRSLFEHFPLVALDIQLEDRRFAIRGQFVHVLGQSKQPLSGRGCARHPFAEPGEARVGGRQLVNGMIEHQHVMAALRHAHLETYRRTDSKAHHWLRWAQAIDDYVAAIARLAYPHRAGRTAPTRTVRRTPFAVVQCRPTPARRRGEQP